MTEKHPALATRISNQSFLEKEQLIYLTRIQFSYSPEKHSKASDLISEISKLINEFEVSNA